MSKESKEMFTARMSSESKARFQQILEAQKKRVEFSINRGSDKFAC